MEVTYLYLLSQLWLTAHLAVSANVSECYWSASKMFDFNCSDGILKINEIYALSKLKSSNCINKEKTPWWNDTAVHGECCEYNEEDDCMTVYNGTSRNEYLSCMSLTRCEKRAANQPSPCGPLYPTVSNYMMIDYDCVRREDILPISSNETNQANSLLTIGSPNFPDGSFPAEEDGVCSVSSSCRTNLTLRALILQLESDGQHLEVKDDHETVTINCSNNTNNTTFELYKEHSNFFTVKFFNTLEKAKGKMWLEVTSSNNGVILDVRCGTSALTSAPSVPECSSLLQVTSSGLSPGPTDSSWGYGALSKSSSSLGPKASSWGESPEPIDSSRGSSLGQTPSTWSQGTPAKSSSSQGLIDSSWSHSSSGVTSSSSPETTRSPDPSGNKSSSSPGLQTSTGSPNPSGEKSSSSPGPKVSTGSPNPSGEKSSSSPRPKVSTGSPDPSGEKSSSSPGPKVSTVSPDPSAHKSSSFPGLKTSTESPNQSEDKSSSSPGLNASKWSRRPSGDTSSSSPGPKTLTGNPNQSGDTSRSSPGPKTSEISGNIHGNIGTSENNIGTASKVNNINGHGPWTDAGMIGGAAAGVAVACLLLLIACIIWRHKKKVGTTPEDETHSASNGLPLPLTGGPLPAITVPSSTQGPRLKPDQGQGEQDEPAVFILPTPTHPPPNRLPPLSLQDPPRLPDVEA